MLGMGRLPAPLPWLLCGRSAFFPRLAPRHPFQKVHPRVVEFSTDEPEAKEENPHVVGCTFGVVGTLAFGACALGGQGLRCDRQAKLDIRLNLTRMVCSVEKAEFNRSHPPNVVEVDCAVASLVVVFRHRGKSSEPCSVKGVLGGGLGLFQACDKLAVGATCVPLNA